MALLSIVMSSASEQPIVEPLASKYTFQKVNSFLLLIAFLGNILMLSYFPKAWITYYLTPRYNLIYDDKKIDNQIITWLKSPKNLSLDETSNMPGAIKIGNSNSPISIIEFSDYECPFCRKVSPILEKIVLKNSDSVSLTILNFPLDSSCNSSIKMKFHETSCSTSMLAICGSLSNPNTSNGLHKLLMTSPISTHEDLEKLDLSSFSLKLDDCLSSEKVKTVLNSQLKLGQDLKINSTPTIYINGKKLEYDSLHQLEKLIQNVILRLK